MVSAGPVRARVVCFCLCVLGMISGECFCVWYLWNWVCGGVRCVLVIFEFLELTRAFAVTYVCDCGVIWRLMVLGVV
jgi:hypothetical protein